MKISVGIPLYKAPPAYLKRAIDSVIAQKGPFEVEVIVCDDASGIDYSGVLKSYPPGTVTYHLNGKNLGMVGNWNACIRMGTGELSMLMGQDDVLAPGMFETYAAEFAGNREAVLCSCARQFIDSDDRRIGVRRAFNDRANIFRRGERYELDHMDVLRLCLRNGNAVGEPSAVMFRRRSFDAVGGYMASYSHAADLDFNIRVSALGTTVYFNRVFLLRRLHKENLTKLNLQSGKLSRDRVRLFETFGNSAFFTRKERGYFRGYMLATSGLDLIRALKGRNPALASYSLRNALRFAMVSPRVYFTYLRELLSGRNSNEM